MHSSYQILTLISFFIWMINNLVTNLDLSQKYFKFYFILHVYINSSGNKHTL